jgi:hypothetical protein
MKFRNIHIALKRLNASFIADKIILLPHHILNLFEEGEVPITQYQIQPTVSLIVSTLRYWVIKNNQIHKTIYLSNIEAIYLNKLFKHESTPKQLHILHEKKEYILNFNDLTQLTRVRNELHKIMLCVFENWNGVHFRVDEMKVPVEKIEIT